MGFDQVIREGNANCRLCGQCLSRCAYLDLDRNEAISEIRKLRSGLATKIVEDKCVSCYACETFCLHGGHPYLAILDRRRSRYRREGITKSIEYMLLPSTGYFRSDAIQNLAYTDKIRIRSWSLNAKEDMFNEIVFPGCNVIVAPNLLSSGFLSNIPVVGSIELCCGEMIFRLGLIDEAERIAHKLEAFWKTKKIRKMVFICPACYNMFENVMPQLFGVKFNFEKVFIVQWLLNRIKTGDFRVKRPLLGQYCIHDSCHARVLGPQFMNEVRDLIRELGGEVVEPPRTGQDGLCCGIASASMKYSPIDIGLKANRVLKGHAPLKEAQSMAYCTGCSLTLTMAEMILPSSVRWMHLLHLVALAGGFRVPRSMRSLAFPAMRAIVTKGVPKLFSKERVHLKI